MYFLKIHGKSFLTYLWLALAASLLLGCASINAPQQIGGYVTAYHQWPAEQVKTFTIAASAEQQGSLEYQAQAKLLAASLTRWGFIEQVGGAAAALTVGFKVSSEQKEIRVTQDTMTPIMGPLWARDRFSYLGSSYYPYPPSVQIYHVQERQLFLAINDAKGQRLYETKLISQGNSANLLEILPSLIDLIMQRFPGESGKTQWVQAPFRP